MFSGGGGYVVLCNDINKRPNMLDTYQNPMIYSLSPPLLEFVHRHEYYAFIKCEIVSRDNRTCSTIASRVNLVVGHTSVRKRVGKEESRRGGSVAPITLEEPKRTLR